MSWLSNILGGGIGDVLKGATSLIDEIITTPEERDLLKLKFAELTASQANSIEETVRAELQAKERVLVAELTQGDAFTKRARPTVVYAGLVFIAYNYCIAPSFALGVLDLPTEFWVAWGGIVATWSIGRTAEKRGAHPETAVESAITGAKRVKSSLLNE